MAGKKRKNNIRVIQDAINPETPEVLASALIGIEKSLKEIRATGLTDDAIAILVAGMRPIIATKADVLLVIDGLARLKSYYVKK